MPMSGSAGLAEELRDAPKNPGEFTGKRIIPAVVRGVIDEVNARLKALKSEINRW